MKLADLIKKAEGSEHSFEIKLPDGEPAGNSLTLKPVDSDEVRISQARYVRLMNTFDKKFEAENAELKAECEEAKDFAEYNIKHSLAIGIVHKAFALELVSGWDFDDEFTEESLGALLTAWPALSLQIIGEAFKAIGAQQKK